MKTRTGFVSNSSSASFVIPRWSAVPEQRKQMIKFYNRTAEQVWKENGVRMKQGPDGELEPDGEVLPELDFGWIDSRSDWVLEVKEIDDIAFVWTCMDNFNMGKWLDWLGVRHYPADFRG